MELTLLTNVINAINDENSFSLMPLIKPINVINKPTARN
jgi:hypothetical protein